MAETEERDTKSEEATEKKLADAVEKGNVPFSREAQTLGSLLGMLIVLKPLIMWAGGNLAATMGALLGAAGAIRLEDRSDAAIMLSQTAMRVALAVIPLLAVLMMMGLLASLAQNMPQANLERIRPKFSRVSPSAGWKRIASVAGAVEFLKSVIKLAAVAAIAATAVKSQITDMLNVLKTDPQSIPATILNLAVRIVAALSAVSLVLAGADIAWSRFKWHRDLRMTKQEVKEEHKQAEGDPFIKLRIRTIARQRTSRRMMAKLPAATVVVANPTHFAVALRYVREEGGAPTVIAKGIDHLALRIRELADSHEIPVIENKPLARALYDKTEIGQSIPEEFYKAVAEIIHFLQVRKMYRAPAARS